MSQVQVAFRTRIAPTPSGYLHMGNALNFLLTYLFSQQHEGTLALRIDDGDATRIRPEYIEDIFATLDWLGIVPNSGPSTVAEHRESYSQALRQGLYREVLDQLLAQGKAYACRCSRKEIASASIEGVYPGTCRNAMATTYASESYAVRAALDTHAQSVRFPDFRNHYRGVNLSRALGDFVLWRKDGLAAYQLVSLWEDERDHITHIVRGMDLNTSTAAQVWLSQALSYPNFAQVKFHLHPLLTGPDAQKLSKSAGASALISYRKQGFSPVLVYSTLAKWLGYEKTSFESLQELTQYYLDHPLA